ncbi:MAG: 30S ribosomal protein S5 [bacterium]
MTAPEKNMMRPRSFGGAKKEPSEFDERVVEVQRISRVVKGGRRIRFRALMVIGNKKGRVGMGVAKANDVSEAVRKATTLAKKHMIDVPIIDGTIPYEVTVKSGSARLILRPASSGTSIVAGGSIRVVAELCGITDLLSKSMGSPNKINNVTACILALSSFNPEYVARIQKMSDNKSALIKAKVPAIDAPIVKTEAAKKPEEPKAEKKSTAKAEEVKKEKK